MAAPPGGTPLDIAAIIDKVLRRNINWPFRTLLNGVSAITLLDHYLTVDATLGNATITLPSATAVKAGMEFQIIRVDAALTNSVTIGTTGGETINGASSATIVLQYSSLSIVSDGTNWLLYASPTAYALATDVLWVFADQLSADQDTNLYTLVAPRAMSFVGVDVKLNVAPTGSDLVVQWLVNNVIIPDLTINVASGVDEVSVSFPFALAQGDTLQPSVPQVGGTTPGFTMVMRARGQ